MTANSDYPVGYGKPPKASQFKKGQSGNPAGRKKGSRSHSERIAAALAEKVPASVNGKRRMISKLDAAFTQLANQAASGDRHAIKLVVEILQRDEIREEARQAGSPFDAEERKAGEALILAALRDQAKTLLPGAARDD